MKPLILEGACVLLPGGPEVTSLRVESGRIAGLDLPRDGARVFDARGLVLAPAMVDVHGDAFERQLMPRPGVAFPLDAALLETDRHLAANGIATAYHALTLSWEPGLRSIAMAEAVVAGLARLTPRLTVENRVQLRWESFCFEALPLIEAAIDGPLAPSIAFNDHTSMAMLHPGTALQDRPFEEDPDFPLADPSTPAFAARMGERARRSGLTVPEYIDLLARVWARRAEVPAVKARVAARGRCAGVPMLSHDDTQAETRAHFRDLGARISEFPMNRTTAEAARAAGDWIVFGAPNAARGGSHLGSPGAGEMIAAGLCDILASDYFYPAMLAAVAKLRAEGHDLARLWPLVSSNPARAMGLTDRGEIAPGQRADLVLLDWPEGGMPSPRLTLVGGRVAYQAEPLGASRGG